MEKNFPLLCNMQFPSVIGQQTIQEKLIHLVKDNRLSHAILLIGKEGSGALPLAMGFAAHLASLLPEKKTTEKLAVSFSLFGEGISSAVKDEHDATEDFFSQRALQLMHPDVHYSYPVITKKAGEKPVSTDFITEWREFYKQNPYGNLFDWLQFIKADNKQGNITSDECNDIIRKLSLKSFESKYKVLVMWMPEYLGKEGNKLLKLIEEPPPNTIFILVAENEEAIIQTILSRCQTIRIPALEDIAIENALIEREHLPQFQARQVAVVAEGNYREAMQIAQHNQIDWETVLRNWLNAAIKGSPKMQLDWINEMAEQGREKQKQFLKYFINLLEQSVRLRILGAARMSLPDKELDFAQRLNKIAGIAQQEALADELGKAIYFIERNAHAKMLFQALTLKLRAIVLEKTVFLTT